MGQTLSVPATDKVTQSGGDGRYVFAVSEMQGWRITMEDAHTIALQLEEGSNETASFFAVYDGHGGGAAARFAGQAVHKKLIAEPAYREKRWTAALKDAFLNADTDLRSDPGHARDPSGCTAVACLITPERKLLCANAGDSRAVISVKGEVKPLSFDHKPQNEAEKARIAAAGGYVEYGRVNGNLALSRALGDFEYKKNANLAPEAQIITANPDITEHELTDEDEFIVVACDGIWDCLSSQQVVNIVRRKVAEGMKLPQIAELLCQHCLAPDTTAGAGTGCDNMTALIVAVLNGKTEDEWYKWVAERVQREHGFPTPAEIPQLYSASRIQAFQARQRAREEARRDTQGPASGGNGGAPESGGLSSVLSGPLGGFARVLGSAGGISFNPGAGIISDTGTLMFDKYDSESDEDEGGPEDTDGGASFFGNSFGAGPDSLHAQIADLEKDEEMGGPPAEGHGALAGATQGEAPPPPAPHTAGGSAPQKQLSSQPAGGEVPAPAVAADGLMDKSEDPLKST